MQTDPTPLDERLQRMRLRLTQQIIPMESTFPIVLG